MAETTASTVAAAPSPSKKASKAKAPKVAKPKVTHPPVAALVLAAIGALDEKNGSSLIAIKKHIANTNIIDMVRLTPFIRRFVKSAVAKGVLVQTKGKGAAGSFKLNKALTEDKPKKVTKKTKTVKPKADTPKRAKATGVKKARKATTPKKPPKKPVKPKAVKPAKAPTPKKPKVPKVTKPKAAKPAKVPVAKKPKAAKSPKKVAPKKAAPKNAPTK